MPQSVECSCNVNTSLWVDKFNDIQDEMLEEKRASLGLSSAAALPDEVRIDIARLARASFMNVYQNDVRSIQREWSGDRVIEGTTYQVTEQGLAYEAEGKRVLINDVFIDKRGQKGLEDPDETKTLRLAQQAMLGADGAEAFFPVHNAVDGRDEIRFIAHWKREGTLVKTEMIRIADGEPDKPIDEVHRILRGKFGSKMNEAKTSERAFMFSNVGKPPDVPRDEVPTETAFQETAAVRTERSAEPISSENMVVPAANENSIQFSAEQSTGGSSGQVLVPEGPGVLSPVRDDRQTPQEVPLVDMKKVRRQTNDRAHTAIGLTEPTTIEENNAAAKRDATADATVKTVPKDHYQTPALRSQPGNAATTHVRRERPNGKPDISVFARSEAMTTEQQKNAVAVLRVVAGLGTGVGAGLAAIEFLAKRHERPPADVGPTQNEPAKENPPGRYLQESPPQVTPVDDPVAVSLKNKEQGTKAPELSHKSPEKAATEKPKKKNRKRRRRSAGRVMDIRVQSMLTEVARPMIRTESTHSQLRIRRLIERGRLVHHTAGNTEKITERKKKKRKDKIRGWFTERPIEKQAQQRKFQSERTEWTGTRKIKTGERKKRIERLSRWAARRRERPGGTLLPSERKRGGNVLLSERSRKKRNEDRIITAKFVFALSALFLLADPTREKRVEIKIQPPGARESSPDQSGSKLQEPTPWILLSIIWYLAMLREQGVYSMPPKKKGKKRRRAQRYRRTKKQGNNDLPKAGIVYAYRPLSFARAVRNL